MGSSKQWLCKFVLATAFGGALSSAASADCLRHIYNRSPYALVVTQNEGPSFSVRPRSSGAFRLAGPGKIDVAAFCSGADLRQPVVQQSFEYQAVLDRCFFEVGNRFFQNELGNGFLPSRSVAPFTLNNPQQGDIILFSRGEECLPQR